MPSSNDPMMAVREYIKAFNAGDPEAMTARR
jgi:hypothetical protein